MPITTSAKKALRVSVRRKKENTNTKIKLKKAVKGARIGVVKNNMTSDMLSDLYRQIDIAAKKKLIHKNKAARLKSRIAKGAKIEATPKAKTVKSKKVNSKKKIEKSKE